MKVCAAQAASAWEDPGANLEKAARLVEVAAGRGADLVIFPEQFATGWSPNSTRFAEAPDGPTVRAFRRLAEEHSVAVLGSFVERHEPKPLNTCVAIDARGDVAATYAKMHPFSPGGEDVHYGSGDRIATFAVGPVRLGIAICYDLRFAPLFRVYARAGVHGVVVASAWPCSRIRAWEILVQARALDNQFYVVGCNPTGTTPVDRYCGHSLSADPVGAVIGRGGEGEELVMTEVDPAKVEAARKRMPVEKDIRPELYHRLSGERHG